MRKHQTLKFVIIKNNSIDLFNAYLKSVLLAYVRECNRHYISW